MNHVLDGVQISPREGAILGIVRTIEKHQETAVVYAAKGIFQSSITVRQRDRHHGPYQ